MTVLFCAWFWPVSDGKLTVFSFRLHRDIKIAEGDQNADIYSYLGVSQSATPPEISSAYRVMQRELAQRSASKAELSLLGASLRALQEDRLRKKYNEILVNEGLFLDL
ncbi:hypothetical protein EV127DRAFT_409700 [Xylaria flabelliformis]|nr:hypothetical protein EV127DRAFT_409700 [Xylaria flabelliformis]